MVGFVQPESEMAEEFFFQLSDESPFAVFALNPDSGEWIYANPAFLALTGMSFEELSGPSLLTLVHSEDVEYLEKTCAEFLREPLAKDLEFRLRHPSGSDTWIRLRPILLTGRGSRYLLGMISDITAEVSNVSSLKKYANKKNSILQILAHDLLGPLGIAQSIIATLEKQSTDPEVISKMEMMSAVNNQAIGLIRDLTTREFLETSRVELVKKRIDLVTKLREYIDECRKSEATSKRNFLFTSSSAHIFISVDESKFFQVINNLLTNSLKFTREWDTISISAEELHDRILITFSDTGIGIPAELQPRIFDKYTEARRTGLQGEPTVGLGLSIVKTILEWHNGTISVSSTENEGTAFFIEIPKET